MWVDLFLFFKCDVTRLYVFVLYCSVWVDLLNVMTHPYMFLSFTVQCGGFVTLL